MPHAMMVDVFDVGLFGVALVVLAAVLVMVVLAITVVRVRRRIRHKRQEVLAAAPRRTLLAFLAENGEEGGPELLAIAEPAWQAAMPNALGLLGKLRGEAHQALVDVFVRRGVARGALRELGSRSPVRRARAAQLLGDLELRQVVPQLCELLTDPHRDVRVVVVRALGRIGDPGAAWRLIAALDLRDSVPSLLATQALVQMGRETEVTLSAALDHPQARVRVVCLGARPARRHGLGAPHRAGAA